MVTNSRMTLSSPISVAVGSPPYLRSCGISPTDANWKMRLPRPMRVRPAITTWLAIVVPALTSTSGPITAKGPTRTSGARRAPAATTAVGWTLAMLELRLYVAHGRHELRLRHELGADARPGRELEHAAHDIQLYRFEDQLVPGKHWPLETGIVDAGEEEQRFGVVALAARHVGEDRRHLRHRLDDEHARHHRIAGKVALEKRLVQRHVLDGLDALPHVALEHAVDQQERIAMRQVTHDLVDIHGRHDHVSSVSRARSSARNRSSIERNRRAAAATRLHSRCGKAGNVPV